MTLSPSAPRERAARRAIRIGPRPALLVLALAACSRSTGLAGTAPAPQAVQLFLLAGQSNMAGRGVVEASDRAAHPRVMVLDRALQWAPAVEPLHYDKPIAGVGPGREFALALAARDEETRIGLIPAAVGGSPISAWEPGALDAATNTHPYDDALARARVAMRDGRLRAILWHQGESDATPALSVRYASRLRALIARFRTDLGDPDLPVLIGQLGQFDGRPWTEATRRVDSVHRAVAATTPNVAYVPSDGLRDKGDTLHFSAAAARELGRRYAAAFLRLTNDPSPPSRVSQQRDPGRAGNGVEPQPEPYAPPPEILGRLNDAPEGRLSEPAMYASKIYGLNFRYRVYVPAQYRPGHAAALMVFQDARSVYLGLMKTPQLFDNLIQTGEMPVTIGLFLDPGTASGEYVQATDRELRSMEYDALDDRYSRFLIDEIIPDVVRAHYDIVDDPDGWGIGGQSSGGIAAFTAGWQRPDRFRKILSQNGSFTNIRGGGEYPSIIQASAVKPLRVYLLSGTKDLNNQFGSWLGANVAMAAALEARGYAYRFRPGAGAHFPPVQAQADYANAMRWLWRGFTLRSYPRP